MKKITTLFFWSFLPLFNFVSAHTGESGGVSDTSGMMGGFSNFFGTLFSVLIVIVLILLIIWLAKQIGDKK